MRGLVFDLRVVIGSPPPVVWNCVLGWDRVEGAPEAKDEGHNFILEGKCSKGMTTFVCECRESWHSDSEALDHFINSGNGSCQLKTKRPEQLSMLQYLKSEKCIEKTMIPIISKLADLPELEVRCALFGKYFDAINATCSPKIKTKAEELWKKVVKAERPVTGKKRPLNSPIGPPFVKLIRLDMEALKSGKVAGKVAKEIDKNPPSRTRSSRSKSKPLLAIPKAATESESDTADDSSDGKFEKKPGNKRPKDYGRGWIGRFYFPQSENGKKLWFETCLQGKLIAEAIFLKYGFDIDRRLVYEISKLTSSSKQDFERLLLWRQECNKRNILNPYKDMITKDIRTQADIVYNKAQTQANIHEPIVGKINSNEVREILQSIAANHGYVVGTSGAQYQRIADILGISYNQARYWIQMATRQDRPKRILAECPKHIIDQGEKIWELSISLCEKGLGFQNQATLPSYRIMQKIDEIHGAQICHGLATHLSELLQVSRRFVMHPLQRAKELGSRVTALSKPLPEAREFYLNSVAYKKYREALIKFKKSHIRHFKQMYSQMSLVEKVNKVLLEVAQSDDNDEDQNELIKNPKDDKVKATSSSKTKKNQNTKRSNHASIEEITINDGQMEESSAEPEVDSKFRLFDKVLGNLYPEEPWVGLLNFLSERFNVSIPKLANRKSALYLDFDKNGHNSLSDEDCKGNVFLQLFKEEYWSEYYFAHTNIKKNKLLFLHVLMNLKGEIPDEALPLLKKLDEHVEMEHVALFRRLVYREDGSKLPNIPPIPDLNDADEDELLFHLCQLEPIRTRQEIKTWINKHKNADTEKLTDVQKLALSKICNENENGNVNLEVAAYILKGPFDLIKAFHNILKLNKEDAMGMLQNNENLEKEAASLLQSYEDIISSCFD